MILIVTEQNDLSADLVIDALAASGADFLRLNTDRLLLDVELDFTAPGTGMALTDEGLRTTEFSGVAAIWYRRPALATPPESMALASAHFA